jgi:hypothetical protein
MPIDIDAAQRFVLTNARLLDRHRLAVIVRGAPVEPVLAALRAYRNPDGGFGHALEPDIRDPASQPASTLHALEVLAGVGALDDRMVSEAAAWVASTAEPDGGVPMALPTAAAHPRAPWMSPSSGGSFLTFALAARLREAGSQEPWLDRATDWCWAELERADELSANGVKFALDFLDTVPDEPRARAAVERLRSRLDADGSIPVSGGLEDERITPLALSERPEGRSRALFTDVQIDADLDRIESGQQDDGGWTFDWAAWSPGQSVEWRGAMTLWVLAVLRAHGRIDVPLGDRP